MASDLQSQIRAGGFVMGSISRSGAIHWLKSYTKGETGHPIRESAGPKT
jgi:hypothetical protein